MQGIWTGKRRERTMRKLEKVPKFRSEKEESEFWATHDSAEYLDYSRAKRVLFPNLKPSTRSISIRLPESLIEHLKVLANKRDIPYQSLLKMLLIEKVEEEFHSAK
jgi:predicted DNA binding CopG/RHH family protein